MSYICNIPDTTICNGKDYLDDGKGKYVGECVSLVKKMCKGSMPATPSWKKGVQVKGNANMVPGMAIASFNPKASKPQYWHAAIYVSHGENGIWVWDQYCRGDTAHPPKLNQLTWKNDGHPRVAGDNFFVID